MRLQQPQACNAGTEGHQSGSGGLELDNDNKRKNGLDLQREMILNDGQRN